MTLLYIDSSKVQSALPSDYDDKHNCNTKSYPRVSSHVFSQLATDVVVNKAEEKLKTVKRASWRHGIFPKVCTIFLWDMEPYVTSKHYNCFVGDIKIIINTTNDVGERLDARLQLKTLHTRCSHHWTFKALRKSLKLINNREHKLLEENEWREIRKRATSSNDYY